MTRLAAPWLHAPRWTWRPLLAAMLRAAGALLDAWARHLDARTSPTTMAVTALPRFEFNAQAGAPEGALYVDGQFVGWLEGVNRL